MSEPDPAAELYAFARQVLATLQAQQRYFACPPGTTDKAALLREARDWERRVGDRGREIIGWAGQVAAWPGKARQGKAFT